MTDTIMGLPAEEFTECPVCETWFHNPKGKQCCSPKCANTYRRTFNKDKICENCDRPFLANKNSSKYCSQECYEEAVYTPEKNCEWCNKTFRHRNTSKSDRRFCSRKCYNKWKKETAKNQSKPCAQCGKNFKGQRVHSLYCSQKCWGLSQRRTFDEDALREDMKTYRRTAQWKQIRKQIRKRDKNTCQVCGRKKGVFVSIDIHHIVPLREFWPDRIRDSEAHSNLIALCQSCHKRVESGSIECPKPKS